MVYMSETIVAEIVYKCDLCGELFNSADDAAQNHYQKAHPEPAEFKLQVTGTSTPAEEREEERSV